MDISEWLPLLIVLLLAGFFAGTIVAFRNINVFSLELQKSRGSLSGRILAKYEKNPAKYVGMGFMGYLISIILFSILFNSTLTPYWDQIFPEPLDSFYLNIIVQIVVAGILVSIFSLLIPRSMFAAQPNKLILISFLPISIFSWILSPILSLITWLSNWALEYLFNVKIIENLPLFKKTKQSLFDDINTDAQADTYPFFFKKILKLPEIQVRTSLTPRKEIKSIDVDSDIEQLRAAFIDTKLSKLIVFKKNIDHITGYIHVLDLFGKSSEIKSLVRPIITIPEAMNINNLLTLFIQKQKSIAWVVDEFGGTAGIITMQDVLGEIFGDNGDIRNKNNLLEQQIASSEYILSGRIDINYLAGKYGFQFGKTTNETLSGYIISHHGSIPSEKDRMIIRNFEFNIIRVSETRVETVKITILN